MTSAGSPVSFVNAVAGQISAMKGAFDATQTLSNTFSGGSSGVTRDQLIDFFVKSSGIGNIQQASKKFGEIESIYNEYSGLVSNLTNKSASPQLQSQGDQLKQSLNAYRAIGVRALEDSQAFNIIWDANQAGRHGTDEEAQILKNLGYYVSENDHTSTRDYRGHTSTSKSRTKFDIWNYSASEALGSVPTAGLVAISDTNPVSPKSTITGFNNPAADPESMLEQFKSRNVTPLDREGEVYSSHTTYVDPRAEDNDDYRGRGSSGGGRSSGSGGRTYRGITVGD